MTFKGAFPLFGQNFVFNVNKIQSRKTAHPENLSLLSQLVPLKLQKLKWKISQFFVFFGQKMHHFPSYFCSFSRTTCLWKLEFSGQAIFLLWNSSALKTKVCPKKVETRLSKYGAVLACTTIVTKAANCLSPPGYIYY